MIRNIAWQNLNDGKGLIIETSISSESNTCIQTTFLEVRTATIYGSCMKINKTLKGQIY